METNPLATAIILSHSRETLGHLRLDWEPQPGTYLEMEGQIYLVLERRHRYFLRSNRYHLKEVALYVQVMQPLIEKSLLDGRWVMGNITCLYNARSELIRCAVNPSGPCDRCVFYESAQG